MNKIPLVDLHAQYAAIGDAIDAAIARVLSSKAFILGPEARAFEEAFARFCGTEACVGCNSGTDALVLALEGMGIGSGDEVITVSMTFAATVEAIVSVGARPVFVDVVPETLSMDVSALEAAVTPKTRAIVPVHLYGIPVDMTTVMSVAERHGLKVLEDAAQAHGATLDGRVIGSIGHAAAFSFYPGKNLGAYGDAGAITTNDMTLAGWIRQARDHGRSGKYEHEFSARSSRLDGLQAAILGAKLPYLRGWNDARRRWAARYDRNLADIEGVHPMAPPRPEDAVYHLYVVRVPERDRVLEALRERGVGAGIHYPVPAHLQPAFRHLGFERGALPVTETACGEILSLPLYPELGEQGVDRVSEALREILSDLSR